MKKYIFLLGAAGIFTMCKKGEASTSLSQNPTSHADSMAVRVEDRASEIAQDTEAVFDSASIRVKDFDRNKNNITDKIESTSKSIDSLSDQIAHMKLESKIEKIDSIPKHPEKIVINVPAPKIIKETKVVYKEHPKNNVSQPAVVKNKMIKTGLLELNVNNAETAKENIKDQVKKYDGYLKSESNSLNNNDKKMAYLKVKVPIQKFDYFMEDLSYDIGKVVNKEIDITGEALVNNTLCDVEITLYGDSEKLVSDTPSGFGSQSLAAVSSGWNVITSIFLFILPLWPLFLIAGTGYYFYKKKKENLPKN